MGKMGGEDCTAALRALGNGRLSEWHGLVPGCSRAHAEEVLGPSESGPDGTGRLGGSPTAFRDYPLTSAAPYGITVWFVLDTIVLVQVNSPRLGEPLDRLLGGPEGTMPSLLAPAHTQWIYASRGLTAHVHTYRHEVLRLYGCAPTTVEEFRNSWLSRVENVRILRQ